MKAVVTGMIATYPVGGVVWDYGQYALGLERLGFEVCYLEDTGWQTYDPARGEYGEDCSYGVRFLSESLAALSPSFAGRWCFVDMGGGFHGMDHARLVRAVAEADLFLNVSGGTLLRDEYMPCRRKVFIDTDPGWNHFRNFPRWDANPGWLGTHGYRAHDHFFTYAEKLGEPGCILPDMGIHWKKTRPPVLLDQWQPTPPGKRWTTVMTWRTFRESILHEGAAFGTKEMEFHHIEDLPRRCGYDFEIAVGGDEAPRDLWRRTGWNVVDSQSVSRTAEDYRGYIQGSRGEISVAKNIYVATGSGWFSCRSVCYLAAGRPVVVQDTGFASIIPTGSGLLSFSDADGALQALECVETDYARHQEAARETARLHFASEKVLGGLLHNIGM